MQPSPSETISETGSPADIRGIKDPVDIPDPWIFLELLLGFILATGVVWKIWSRFAKRTPPVAPTAAPIPPHERALRELHAALACMGQARPFCIQISDAVRAYLEAQFNLQAPDRTTEEFIAELRLASALTPNQQSNLATFLERCDLVKFAKLEPHEAELRFLFEAAKRFIDETQPAAPVSDRSAETPESASVHAP